MLTYIGYTSYVMNKIHRVNGSIMLRKEMTQKKLLLTIVATIFVSLILNIFYNSLSTGAVVRHTPENWTDDVGYIAFTASEYWQIQSTLDSDSKGFTNVKDIADLGVDKSLLKGNYSISNVSDKEFTVVTRNLIEGSIVKSKINYQGIAGLPVIEAI